MALNRCRVALIDLWEDNMAIPEALDSEVIALSDDVLDTLLGLPSVPADLVADVEKIQHAATLVYEAIQVRRGVCVLFFFFEFGAGIMAHQAWPHQAWLALVPHPPPHLFPSNEIKLTWPFSFTCQLCRAETRRVSQRQNLPFATSLTTLNRTWSRPVST